MEPPQDEPDATRPIEAASSPAVLASGGAPSPPGAGGSTHEAEEPPYWVEVMVHWLTGVVFALLLGAFLILVAPMIPGLSPILRLTEDRGVDLAMRVRAAASPPAEASALRYVFVDIDAPACARLGLGARCDRRSPADPELLADTAAAVLPAGPALVVIDAAVWDLGPTEPTPSGAFRRLVRAARAPHAAPIVAAGPYRPGSHVGTAVREADLIPADLRAAPIRYAPSFLYPTPGAQDDMIRAYTTVVRLEGTPGSMVTVPTLPMLAALYAEARGDPNRILAVDCRFATTFAPEAPCADGTSETAGDWPANDPGLRLGPDARLVFAFPSASVPGEGPGTPRYERVLASQALGPDGSLLADPSVFAGKVVVISTSDAHALDQHNTPLGAMAGAEIVVNAIDAVVNRGWMYPPTPLGRLGREAEITLVSSLPFLAFWAGIFALRRAPWSTPWKPALVHAAGFIGFLMAVAAAMLGSGFVTVAALVAGRTNGFATEFFTPIFALSLEGFAEGASWLLSRLEQIVEMGLRHLHRRLTSRA